MPDKEWAEIVTKLRRERDAARAENEALRSTLIDVVDDLEHYVKNEYPNRETYPSSMRRYLRDMEPVNKARAVLRGEVE